MVVNISEACAHLGYRSRSTVQRLIKAGHLDAYLRPGGGRSVLLETDPEGMPSLRSAVQALTQYRPESPLWERQRERLHRPPVELRDADRVKDDLDATPTPDWEAIARQLNAYLGPTWPMPPYSADQAATMAMALSLAEELGLERIPSDTIYLP